MYQNKYESHITITPTQKTNFVSNNNNINSYNPAQVNPKVVTSLVSMNRNNQKYEDKPKSHIVVRNSGFNQNDSFSLQQIIPVRRAPIFGESQHGSHSQKNSKILPDNLLDPVDNKYHLSKISKQSQKKFSWLESKSIIPQQIQCSPSLQVSPQFKKQKSLKKQVNTPRSDQLIKQQFQKSNQNVGSAIDDDLDQFYDFQDNTNNFNNKSNTAYQSILKENLLNFDSSRQDSKDSLNFKRTSSKIMDKNNSKLAPISQKSNDQISQWILKDQQKKRQQEQSQRIYQQKEQERKRKEKIQSEYLMQRMINQQNLSNVPPQSQQNVINYTDLNNNSNSSNMSGQTVNIGKAQQQNQALSMRKRQPSNIIQNVVPVEQFVRQYVPIHVEAQVQTSFSYQNKSQNQLKMKNSSNQSQLQDISPQFMKKKSTKIDRLNSQQQISPIFPLPVQIQSRTQANNIQLENIKRQMVGRSQFDSANQKLQRISTQIRTELPYLHKSILQNQQTLNSLQKQLIQKRSLDNQTYKNLMQKIIQKQSLLYQKERQLLQKQRNVSHYRQINQKMKMQRQLQTQELRRLQFQKQHQNRIGQLTKYNQKLCEALIQNDDSREFENYKYQVSYPNPKARNKVVQDYDLKISEVQHNLKELKKINQQKQFNAGPMSFNNKNNEPQIYQRQIIKKYPLHHYNNRHEDDYIQKTNSQRQRPQKRKDQYLHQSPLNSRQINQNLHNNCNYNQKVYLGQSKYRKSSKINSQQPQPLYSQYAYKKSYKY